MLASPIGHEIERDCPDLRPLGPDAMPEGLLRVLWNERLEFAFGVLVREIGCAGLNEDRGVLGPRVRGAHINDLHRRDLHLWRLYTEHLGWVPGLNAAP